MNRLIAVLVLCLPVLTAQGADNDNAIRDTIKKALPTVQIDAVQPSPIEGISEVLIGANVYYLTNDGRYVIQGNLIDMATRTDLTEERLKGVRHELVDKVSETDMIVFAAKQPRHTITVFTDLDCGYCRKLHSQIGAYNDQGISVRYLLYPRNGINTPSFQKAVSVWCSEDRQTALTRAKAGEIIENKTCDNPLGETQKLARTLGVRGTPAILLEDGDLLPGYVPPVDLAKALDK